MCDPDRERGDTTADFGLAGFDRGELECTTGTSKLDAMDDRGEGALCTTAAFCTTGAGCPFAITTGGERAEPPPFAITTGGGAATGGGAGRAGGEALTCRGLTGGETVPACRIPVNTSVEI